MLKPSRRSMAPNSTSTWTINFAAMRLPSIYAPFETCNNMSLIQAADDSSNADNSVHIRLIFPSSAASASRACPGFNDALGLLRIDLFDRDANLTFQYYCQLHRSPGQPYESYSTLDANVEQSHFEKSQQIVSIWRVDIHDTAQRISYYNESDNRPFLRVRNNCLVARILCRITNS